MAWDGQSSVAHRTVTGGEARLLLEGIAERARSRGRKALVIFDLDSTLLDNRPRQSQILVEYGIAHGVQELANNRPEHWAGWDARIAMRNSGLREAQVLQHFDAFRSYWRDRFFTSEYCVVDGEIPGAGRYVRALAELCTIAYVTGRHEPMRAGTVACLERLKFPVPGGPHVHLLMKPSFEEADDDYKVRVVDEIPRRGEAIAAFDNEPAHINGYALSFPDVQCVHLATDHSMRDMRVAPSIVSICDFRDFSAFENATR